MTYPSMQMQVVPERVRCRAELHPVQVEDVDVQVRQRGEHAGQF